MILLVKRRDVAPDHHANDGVGTDVLLVERADQAAVAQHGDAVTERIDLVHAVRDVDDGKPLGAELTDQRKQPLAFAG